jgi:hypothetical protein
MKNDEEAKMAEAAAQDRAPKARGRTCEHGLHWLRHEGERVCALEYLNRFVAPRKVERVSRHGRQLFLVFDTGERLECCCESCGESHGDDREFTNEIRDVALGRRALRFRLEDPDGHLVVWFARGDHLHLHRNALKRFRPSPKLHRRSRRSVRPAHSPSEDKPTA